MSIKRVSKSKSVEINNVAELRAVCAEFGVQCPKGVGKPPKKRLAKALADAGINVTPTQYFDGTVSKPITNPGVGKGEWTVTATMPQIAKGAVRRNKDGDVVSSGRTKSVTLTVAQIRELTNAKPSGRLSHDAVAKAGLMSLLGDRFDESLLGALPVEAKRVGAETAPTASDDTDGEDDTPAVDLDAQADAETVDTDAENVAA